jgi:proline racemase
MRFSSMITAVDLHACGEPGRVITGGVLDIPGRTMFEKKTYLEQHGDGLRKRMLREPRGYPAANCNLLLPPTDPRAHAGFVIMEQVEYPPMSGTNTICVVTTLIETGMVAVSEPITNLTLETPAGLVQVEAQVQDGKVKSVTFENVPAFAMHLDAKIEVPQLGTVTVDVAYGGMFYVIAEAQPLGPAALARRRARHCSRRRNDQGRRSRTVAGCTPGDPRDSRHYHRRTYRPAHESGCSRQECSRRFNGTTRLEQTRHLDWCDRQVALRNRNLRAHGRALRQG